MPFPPRHCGKSSSIIWFLYFWGWNLRWREDLGSNMGGGPRGPVESNLIHCWVISGSSSPSGLASLTVGQDEKWRWRGPSWAPIRYQVAAKVCEHSPNIPGSVVLSVQQIKLIIVQRMSRGNRITAMSLLPVPQAELIIVKGLNKENWTLAVSLSPWDWQGDWPRELGRRPIKTRSSTWPRDSTQTRDDRFFLSLSYQSLWWERFKVCKVEPSRRCRGHGGRDPAAPGSGPRRPFPRQDGSVPPSHSRPGAATSAGWTWSPWGRLWDKQGRVPAEVTRGRTKAGGGRSLGTW
jgi:hypothetical protein